jgi:GAF domain-containing protein
VNTGIRVEPRKDVARRATPEGDWVPKIDGYALQAALGKLTDVSAARDLEDTVADVTQAAASVFAVDGTGLMFLDEQDALRYVAASDDASRALEVAQEVLGVGPCVDSLVLDQPIASVDLANETRWPGLSDMVVPAGVRAVLGVPVRVGSGAVGSLNAYADAPHDWDDSEIEALQKFAEILDGVLINALLAHKHGELARQLQYALDNRVVIERAIGVLMGRAGDLDAVAAFNRLRTKARGDRRRVGEVAAELLSGALDLA